jgi:hypothetical protein
MSTTAFKRTVSVASSHTHQCARHSPHQHRAHLCHPIDHPGHGSAHSLDSNATAAHSALHDTGADGLRWPQRLSRPCKLRVQRLTSVLGTVPRRQLQHPAYLWRHRPTRTRHRIPSDGNTASTLYGRRIPYLAQQITLAAAS